jgi:hypothetical protein
MIETKIKQNHTEVSRRLPHVPAQATEPQRVFRISQDGLLSIGQDIRVADGNLECKSSMAHIAVLAVSHSLRESIALVYSADIGYVWQ